MRFSKTIVTLLGCSVFVLLLPVMASAGTLRLTIENLTTGGFTEILDNGVGDTDSTLGSIQTDYTDSVINLRAATALSKPETGDVWAANLHLDAVFNALAAGSIQLSLYDTGFDVGVGLGDLALESTLGGVYSGPKVDNAYGTVAATSGAITSGGVVTTAPLVDNGDAENLLLNGMFGATDFANFVANDPYSLFSQVTLNFVGASTRTGSLNFDTAVPIPEPATLLLFGSGLVGMTRFARRRRLAAQA
jgi:hypothetical protein